MASISVKDECLARDDRVWYVNPPPIGCLWTRHGKNLDCDKRLYNVATHDLRLVKDTLEELTKISPCTRENPNGL